MAGLGDDPRSPPSARVRRRARLQPRSQGGARRVPAARRTNEARLNHNLLATATRTETTAMANTHLYGYSDQISVRPGERIRFMVSVEGATRYRAEIVRLINGDANPAGPGPKEEVIATPANREYPGRLQPTYSGSHIVVDDPGGLLNIGQSITVHAFIMPTTPARGAQGIITHYDPERRMGWALVIDEQGRLALWVGDGDGRLVQVAAPEPLIASLWYSAGASYD